MTQRSAERRKSYKIQIRSLGLSVNVVRTVRAMLMPSGRIARAIAERVHCCIRPNLLPEGCPGCTSADHQFWKVLAARFVKKNPDNADGWIVLGYSRWQLAMSSVAGSKSFRNDLDGAVKACRVAARLKDDADTWYSLAVCAQGDERIAALRKALSRSPDDRMSWHFLGNALTEVGRYSEAEACFKRALDGNNASAGFVLCDLGMCYLAAHRQNDSIDAFEQSILADAYAFDCMYGNVADACLDNPEFAHLLYERLKPINPDKAEKFLRCWTYHRMPERERFNAVLRDNEWS